MSSPEFDANKLFPGKFFISTVLDVLESKKKMTGHMRRRYLQRAAMAGIIIAIFYVIDYTMVGAFDSIGDDEQLHVVGKLLGSLTFGWALVFIYYSKSELLTSNMMMVAIGTYYRRISLVLVLRILLLCYLGNIIGGLLIAVMLKGTTLIEGPVLDAMNHSVDVKTGYLGEGWSGWLDLFIRAVLCNFMINLAMLLVYNGYLHEDMAKIMAMIVAVFVFAFLDFEHSVANTVLFMIVGLQDGIPVGAAFGNLGIVLLGNLTGGGILIGFYYAWVNDERDTHLPHLRRSHTRH
ncbi:formate/nitrite transporter family protein [Gordonia sp. ABSL49_1]|uniref:formate/nitrite transporter family protein n=1 Tax=unclassified Gordonia (in: high G+C Gram-positive bacteria) TaxID=2657482 RepID=UPI001F0D37A0|nr:formate/nitrite transporter family protein [Gordonia sp. ABSL49_1]MCH5645035.1 formate/nitrite transporter family protein [Gordonia sp. ABSL49_1]